MEVKPGLEAPIAKDAVIGKVVAKSNSQVVGESPLVALIEVERANTIQSSLMLNARHGHRRTVNATSRQVDDL